MNTDPQTSAAQPAAAPPDQVSHLEMSGAIMSRMIHELTNQLTVMAGHAQLAESGLLKPEAMGPTLKAMRQASETLAEIVERYAGFRRQVADDTIVASLGQLCGAVAAGLPDGWEAVPAETGDLDIRFESRWLVYAVRQVIALSQASRGQVRFNAPGSGFDPRGATSFFSRKAEQAIAHVVVGWPSESRVFYESDFLRPKTIDLAVVIGLVRWVGGQVNYTFFPPDENRFWISLPVLRK